MLRITANKVAQVFPERYPGEHTDLRTEYARDEAGQAHYDESNVYFIRETFIDPTSGQETERTSDDGYISLEQAESIARSGLEDSMQEGAVEVDIIHKTEGWVKTVWSHDAKSMVQPMAQPFPR